MVPQTLQDSHRGVRRARKEFDRTADGTLLKNIKLSTKVPTTIKLPMH